MRWTLPAWSLLALVAFCISPARAATAVDVVNVDLAPLIDEAARHQNRFAVDIPHSISPATQGQWETIGSTRRWSYSVRIPTAVSMSFHASRFALPAGAVLTVSGANASATYRVQDASRGGLWSRPLRGDTLAFSITVDAKDAAAVQLEIASLQAGYRGLGGGVPDNPYYKRMHALAVSPSSCTQNYSCNATSANDGPAHATVAVLIGNVGQCTGTLLNNTRGDGTPYVLTARHCESGNLGGGNPGAAASVTVYWDAVTPCGTVLGSLYDGSAYGQAGAVTMVEQQDAWLIRLDADPVAPDAYYAGWDATGATFTGGYSIHHAQGDDKQYVGWFGQAILEHIPGSTLSVGYGSDLWGVVNQLGNVGAGASGGALFDPADHVVGSSSLAYLTSKDGPGVCPASSPSAPSPATVTAQYTALSAVWNSTADTTSTTGSTTIQSVLDPDHTGQLVIPGVALTPMTFTSDMPSGLTGQIVTLTWNAPGAQSCTATGGSATDGWAGARPPSGTLELTETSGGDVTYSLACTGRSIQHASIAMFWQFAPVYLSMNVFPQEPVVVGSTVTLQWSASDTPCIGSDGINGDGWAGTKSNTFQNVVVSTIGDHTYTITCGTGGRTAVAHVQVTAVGPAAGLTSEVSTMRVGETVNLLLTVGGQCSATGGGAANDNWVGTTFALSDHVSAFVWQIHEDTVGTYTYGLTCTAGGQTSTATAVVTFTNDPPSVTFTATATPQELSSDSPNPTPPPPNLFWTANVGNCRISATGPGQPPLEIVSYAGPTGSLSIDAQVAGHFVYTITCGTTQTATATTSMDWFTTKPSVRLLYAPDNTMVANLLYQVFWQTNVAPCTFSGGTAGDGWAHSEPYSSGSVNLTESVPGTYTFAITCGSGAQTAQTQVTTTVPPPSVTITASPSSIVTYLGTTLQWNSTIAPCVASGGSPNDAWAGRQLPPVQYSSVFGTVPGTYTYTITCGSGANTVQASTDVTYTSPPVPMSALSASAASVEVNTPVTLTWSSTNATSCAPFNGLLGDGWVGVLPISGSKTLTSSIAGTITYSLNCDGGISQTQVEYTPAPAAPAPTPTPTATLSASPGSQVAGRSVTLTWSSENASACTASGGGNGDGWAGNLTLSGSMAVTEPSAGTFTYSLVCTGAPPAASVQTSVTFSAAPGTSGGGGQSSGGGGGGGAFTAWWLLMLSVPVGVRVMRRRACHSPISVGMSSDYAVCAKRFLPQRKRIARVPPRLHAAIQRNHVPEAELAQCRGG